MRPRIPEPGFAERSTFAASVLVSICSLCSAGGWLLQDGIAKFSIDTQDDRWPSWTFGTLAVAAGCTVVNRFLAHRRRHP